MATKAELRQRALRTTASYAREQGLSVREVDVQRAESLLFGWSELYPDTEVSGWVNAAYSEGASPNQAKMFRCEWRKYAGARAE